MKVEKERPKDVRRDREIERKGIPLPPHCRQCTRQSFRSAAQFSGGFWFLLSLFLLLEWIVSFVGVKREGGSEGAKEPRAVTAAVAEAKLFYCLNGEVFRKFAY